MRNIVLCMHKIVFSSNPAYSPSPL